MHNLLTAIWLIIKAIVSFVAATGGLYIFFVMSQTSGLSHSKPWVILAISMFLAVAPWVFFEQKQSRAFALVSVFMGISLIFFAIGVPYTPRDCSTLTTGRSRGACSFFNWLYNLGGANLIATFYITLGLSFLIFGYALYKKHVARRLDESAL
jgi:SPW repeat